MKALSTHLVTPIKRALALTIILLIVAFSRTYAQEDLVQFFPAGQDNAKVLVDQYVQVLAEGFTAANNGGWYTTGKTHDKFGFELNATINTVFVPSSKLFFSFSSLGLSGVGLDPDLLNPNNTGDLFPTALGPENIYPYMLINSVPNNGATFRGPEGVDLLEDVPLLKAIAVPTLQMGIGLWKKTDLKIRFTPKIKISDTEFNTLGFGLMHDIKQHIPGISKVPMGLSFLIAYSKFEGTVELHNEYGGPNEAGVQEGVFKSTGVTIQALVSKTISVLTLYGGVGYNSGKSDFDVKGTYIVGDPTSGGESLLSLNTPIKINPFSISYESTGVRGTVGMRLKFGPVTLNGDYTVANDKVLTLGFGFAHR